jgi:Outer membrane protein beta-barrel domain
MRKLLMAALVALLVPTASFAQFQLGLRLGYSPAMGDEQKDLPLKDTVKSQIPIQVDAMYKVTKDVAVGGYFSYGFGQLNSDLKDGCDATGLDCSASNMRLGLQAAYTFNQVTAPLVPWAAVGFGYEWTTLKVALGGASGEATTSGFEFLNLQLGGDYKVNEQFAIGPYAQLSIGQYSSIEGNSITDKGMHQWLGFGLRGKFDL